MRKLNSLAAALLVAAPLSYAQPDGQSFARVLPVASPPDSCAFLSIVTQGRPINRIEFRGQKWVEAQPGAEYSLVLNNHCPYRVLSVVSVDGLNVLTGKEAGYSTPGYVLSPGQSSPISGWRKSNDHVAAFYFSSPANSYAERVGHGQNLGVIGAAFFQEKYLPPLAVPEVYMQKGNSSSDLGVPKAESSARSALGASPPAPAAAPILGTGHGRRIDSRVETTTFDRSAAPFSVESLRYESRDRLIAMGAIPKPHPTGPNPFPSESTPSFVPDPPPAHLYSR
jgi:hypothetical protein